MKRLVWAILAFLPLISSSSTTPTPTPQPTPTPVPPTATSAPTATATATSTPLPTPTATATRLPMMLGYMPTLMPDCKITYPRPDGWSEVKKTLVRNGYRTSYSQHGWPPTGATVMDLVVTCYIYEKDLTWTQRDLIAAMKKTPQDAGADYFEEITANFETPKGLNVGGGVIYRNTAKSKFGIILAVNWFGPGKLNVLWWESDIKYEKDLSLLYADMLPKFRLEP